MVRRLVLLATFLVAPAVGAQELPPEIPEAWLEAAAEDEEADDLLDALERLQSQPIDVNTADADALAAVPGLSPRLAEAIVRHRRRHGAFTTLQELRTVEGLPEEALEVALPFLTVRAPGRRRPAPRAEALVRAQRRVERAAGYRVRPDGGPPPYAGGPERLYGRVRLQTGPLAAHLTLEKDPGEALRWNPGARHFGTDFVSAHAAVQGAGALETLVVGDYVVDWGQGLALWRPAGFGKGADPVRPLVRRGRGVRPYASTDENRHFRGVAATVTPLPHLRLTAFASRHAVDARLDTLATTGATVVRSRPTSGLHRTAGEQAARKTLGQTVLGGGTEALLGRAAFGLAVHRTTWDYPLEPGSAPHQRHDPRGRTADVASFHGRLALERAYLFGEAARDGRGHVALLGGVETTSGPLTLLVLGRRYPAGFFAPHAFGFGDRNGATRNEEGLYLGATLRPAARWLLAGYADTFRTPWARYGAGRPSHGLDALFFVEHRPRRWLTVAAQGRSTAREVGRPLETPAGATLDGLEPDVRQSARLDVTLTAHAALRVRSRVAVARHRRGEDAARHGSALAQEVRWAASRRVTATARLTLFATDGFGARLYQHEPDLPGVLTNSLLHGQGSRAFVLLALRPRPGLDVHARIATWRYEDRTTVGSGHDAVDGPRARDLGLAVRYRL